MCTNYLILIVCVLLYYYSKSTSYVGFSLKFYMKYILFYISVLVIATFYWPLFLRHPRNMRNIKLLLPAARTVSKAIQIDWEVRDSVVLTEDMAAVIVSNHQSSLDVLGILHVTGIIKKLTCVVKKDLFYVWPFGLAAYLAGSIFITRNNTKDAYQTLNEVSKILVMEKAKIWIFPEGTRNMSGKLLPFKKGAFILAVMAQIPIIPVVFSPFHFIDMEKRVFGKGKMVIKCLDAISTLGMTEKDVPQLIDTVQHQMCEAHNKLKTEIC